MSDHPSPWTLPQWNEKTKEPGIAHGFFGRKGGVSTGIYASLNCGLHSGDDQDAVRENRERIKKTLGGISLFTLKQVHSNRCVLLDSPYQATEDMEADALVTTLPGLVVAAQSADCGPVLLFGKRRGNGTPVIGAVHAGWGGALIGVLESALRTMVEEAEADIASITAGIGPCIGPESYEVSPGFDTPFLKEDPQSASFFRRDKEKHFFDLPSYLAFRLRRAGIGQIETLSKDTFAQKDDCFSFRRATQSREGTYGRQLSAILIRE